MRGAFLRPVARLQHLDTMREQFNSKRERAKQSTHNLAASLRNHTCILINRYRSASNNNVLYTKYFLVPSGSLWVARGASTRYSCRRSERGKQSVLREGGCGRRLTDALRLFGSTAGTSFSDLSRDNAVCGSHITSPLASVERITLLWGPIHPRLHGNDRK